MIELAEIEAARARIADVAVRTPLVRLRTEDAPAEIYLKLETLQPIGSFKIRGATNAVRSASKEDRRRGLVTASAGNMAQGVAWAGRELGLPVTIAVPEHAPQAKLDAIERLGGRVLKVPYDEWWQAIVTSRVDGVDGLFVHPVQDEGVMAGNGTIGLEILEDLPEPDAVVIPYGGGGLTVGIASAIRALRPQTKIYTAEPATGAALVAALAAGGPADVQYSPSFVDGSGSRRVLDTMWPRVRPLIDDALSIPIADAAAAVQNAGRARARDRRGSGGAGHGRRAHGPRGNWKGGVHRVRWEHRHDQAGRHPRGRFGMTEDLREPVLPGPGASDYERYLRTDELLSLQKTAEERVHHDELLFQTVHQSSELWLKFATTEVDEAAASLERDRVDPALRLLRRAVVALGYVTTQMEMLNQMDPWEYSQIRVVLGHGSGFDSPGFRRVPAVTQRVAKAFDHLLSEAGLDLTELYQHGREHEQLYQLAELLTEWDERIWVWRFRHYTIVARALGEDTVGTQGTPVQVLGKLIAQRQIPKLWDVRSRLVELFDAEHKGTAA